MLLCVVVNLQFLHKNRRQGNYQGASSLAVNACSAMQNLLFGHSLKNISICIHFHTTTVENGLLRSIIIFSLKRFPLRRCIVLTTAWDENFYCYIKKRTKKNDMCVYYFWHNELVTMRGMLECLKLHVRNVFVWKSLGWATDLLHIC